MMWVPEGNVPDAGRRPASEGTSSTSESKAAKDRAGWPWIFRYYADEIQSDGSVKTLRKYQEIGPSKGEGAITKKQAEIERDKFLAKLNAPTVEVAVQQVAVDRRRVVQRGGQRCTRRATLAGQNQSPGRRAKRRTFYLDEYIVPRWGDLRLNQIQPQAVEDWLHTTFDSWWTMHGVRAIMNRIYHYAEGHGLWEEGKRTPVAGRRWGKNATSMNAGSSHSRRPRACWRSLTNPTRLIIETCIATGARNLRSARAEMEAREPRAPARSRSNSASGTRTSAARRAKAANATWESAILVERYRAKAAADAATPDSFVFQQKRAPGRPLWDSGVRDALHQAAEAEGCDFPGLGPHSFRRANITWRQQVGGSAIEASKIAGHSDLEMTGEYTFVTPERQNELTRLIQAKLAESNRKIEEKTSVGTSPVRPRPMCHRVWKNGRLPQL